MCRSTWLKIDFLRSFFKVFYSDLINLIYENDEKISLQLDKKKHWSSLSNQYHDG